MWLALWVAPVAALAAASTIRSWEAARPAIGSPTSTTRRRAVVAGGTAAIVLGAVAGPWVAATMATVVVIAVMLDALVGPPGVPGAGRRALIVLAPAAAGVGLVLARVQGLDQGLVLAGMVCTYDSAAYLIGAGSNNPWEGPVAGVASVGALTLLVAAVLFSPFQGSSPWILGGMAALLAPLGALVASRLTPDRSARVPALRRLDSLILLGPLWAAGTALLLHR